MLREQKMYDGASQQEIVDGLIAERLVTLNVPSLRIMLLRAHRRHAKLVRMNLGVEETPVADARSAKSRRGVGKKPSDQMVDDRLPTIPASSNMEATKVAEPAVRAERSAMPKSIEKDEDLQAIFSDSLLNGESNLERMLGNKGSK